ncbi:MAG: hypothetical protein NTAFB05_19350 [Nitrobacter sp.]
MATDSQAKKLDKKLFVGPRFRRIRQQLGLSQTQIAEGLGISPSYVNLIERNQRPVTAQILLRLAESYDLDLRDLATADEDRFFAELNEVFSDPLFRRIDIPKQELRDLAELCPGVTHALQRLYAAYTEARRGETMAAAQFADRDEGARFEANPIERVRDLIEANRNYFPEPEQAAETLRDEINVPAQELFAALSARLREKHSIQTRIMPVDVMRETLRRFDRHRRQLLHSLWAGFRTWRWLDRHSTFDTPSPGKCNSQRKSPQIARRPSAGAAADRNPGMTPPRLPII